MKLSKDNYFVSIHDDVKYYRPTDFCSLFWFSLLVLVNGFTSIISSIFLIIKYFKRDFNANYIHTIAFAEKAVMTVSLVISIVTFKENTNFWTFLLAHVLFLGSVIVVIFGAAILYEYWYTLTMWWRRKFPKVEKVKEPKEPGFIEITKIWWKGFKEKHCELIEYEDAVQIHN